jgi:hypothetical protein
MVGSIYGLESFRVAVAHRYVGATIGGGVFRAWFHWPLSSRLRRWAAEAAGTMLGITRKPDATV